MQVRVASQVRVAAQVGVAARPLFLKAPCFEDVERIKHVERRRVPHVHGSHSQDDAVCFVEPVRVGTQSTCNLNEATHEVACSNLLSGAGGIIIGVCGTDFWSLALAGSTCNTVPNLRRVVGEGRSHTIRSRAPRCFLYVQ